MKKKAYVQSVLFTKSNWTPGTAYLWLQQHGYKTPRPDTTKRFYRYRQMEPGQFARIRNIWASRAKGVMLVTGFK